MSALVCLTENELIILKEAVSSHLKDYNIVTPYRKALGNTTRKFNSALTRILENKR